MKTKPFLTLSIVTASVFALTLLVSSISNAQDKAAEAAVSDSTEAAEDVSWDDNKGPGPKPFPDRPRSGDKRGPFADRPNHDRPPMEGFRPPREGRPGMDRPPMAARRKDLESRVRVVRKDPIMAPCFLLRLRLVRSRIGIRWKSPIRNCSSCSNRTPNWIVQRVS